MPSRHQALARSECDNATTAMTHVAIVEKLDGKSVDWMEKLTDEQGYGHF
jgi:hypothetical protein